MARPLLSNGGEKKSSESERFRHPFRSVRVSSSDERLFLFLSLSFSKAYRVIISSFRLMFLLRRGTKPRVYPTFEVLTRRPILNYVK